MFRESYTSRKEIVNGKKVEKDLYILTMGLGAAVARTGQSSSETAQFRFPARNPRCHLVPSLGPFLENGRFRSFSSLPDGSITGWGKYVGGVTRDDNDRSAYSPGLNPQVLILFFRDPKTDRPIPNQVMTAFSLI